MHRFALALVLLCRVGLAQATGSVETTPAEAPPLPRAVEAQPAERDAKLPNGRSRSEAILKEDHEHNLKDAAALIELAQSVQADLEKEGRDVLSLQTLKKLDEIDKLTKRIRSRMRRY